MTLLARSSKTLLLPLVLPCLAACGDDDTGGGGPVAATGPAYAITVQVFGPDASDSQSYVTVTDSIESDAPLSLDSGVEVLGRAIGAGPDGGGAVFVASDAAPTVTRYDLQDDGSLKQGDTISFQAKGLASIGEYGSQFQFISETKAYFFDGPTAQVVIWNPQEMRVTGEISLAELVIEDTTLSYSTAPLRRGDDVITFAGWRKGLEVPSQAAVVIVDSATDEATVVTDDRCGYVRDGVEGPDGMIYLATEAFGAAVHRVNAENAPAPCLLRFDPETRQFDPDFHVEINTLFDGATAGSLILGSGGEAYLRVLDEAVIDIKEDTHPRMLASAGAWRWASVTLGDSPEVTLLDDEPSGGSVLSVSLGERSFVLQYQGQEATTFRELGADGPGEVSLSAPGLVFSAAKMR